VLHGSFGACPWARCPRRGHGGREWRGDAVPIKPMVLRQWRVLWLCRCPKPSCVCAWTTAARSRWPLAGAYACTACPRGVHVQGKITVKAACLHVLHYGVQVPDRDVQH